jgi:hypothetical protein
LRDSKQPGNLLLNPNSLLLVSLILAIAVTLSGCNLLPISEEEALKQTQIRETELDINVKQTLLVQQQSNRAAQQTAIASAATSQVEAPKSPSPSSPPLPPEADETPSEPVVQVTEVPPIEIETPQPINEEEFNAWMKSAKILLYEDMTARLDTIRYAKSTLDEMGLLYKNDGSAYGWLLDDLKNGPPEGGQWDLIIFAAEDKAGVKADFFAPTLNAIEQGTSVILEVWYLDGAHATSASGLLQRCGVEYENNWIRVSPSRAALFILSPDNPIMQRPNHLLSFTATTNYWWDPNGEITYDTGDLIKTLPDSGASLLLGTTANVLNSHGTSTVCMDGQLTMQTFSSHVLKYEVMYPLWENYIYNALLTRFSHLN